MSRPLVTAGALATLAWAGPLGAQTFAPVQPATCPARTEVNWQFNIGNYGTGEWMVPQDDFNNPGHYANNVHYKVEITANERVNEMYLRFDAFDTEPWDDYLQVYSYSPDGLGNNDFYSGSQPPPLWSPMKSLWPFPRTNAFFLFHSDATENYAGISGGRAAVCTRNPGAPIYNYYREGWPNGIRHNGLLLGTNDVVYFRFPVGSQKAGDDCSAAHDTFALQGDPTQSPWTDFDLYIKCGSVPTPSDFTARDFAGPGPVPHRPTEWANTGFLHADPGSCPCGSYWYVAVHSYSGAGWFNLWNHKHYAAHHWNWLSVSAADQDLTATQISQTYMPEMADGMAHFFGANEGTRFIGEIHFSDQCSGCTTADVMIHNYSGRPHADKSCAWYCGPFWDCNVNLYTVWEGYGTFEASTLSHELGHYLNCLDDEYDDDDGVRCGHSVMGNHWDTVNDYCYCDVYHQSACFGTHGDHGRDGSTYYNTEIWGTWNDNMSSPISVTATPDNYDFFGFDFHGGFASPVITNYGNQ